MDRSMKHGVTEVVFFSYGISSDQDFVSSNKGKWFL
jgi:hypothetical protein